MAHVGPEVEGHQAKIGRSTPKIVIFGPFLAFEGRLGGLNGALEVQVEDKTCRTIHGTHLEGILSQKKLTGLAGRVREGQGRSGKVREGQNMAPEMDSNQLGGTFGVRFRGPLPT